MSRRQPCARFRCDVSGDVNQTRACHLHRKCVLIIEGHLSLVAAGYWTTTQKKILPHNMGCVAVYFHEPAGTAVDPVSAQSYLRLE